MMSRLAMELYVLSLVVLLPTTVACVVASLLRTSSGGTRALVWRVCVVAIVMLVVVRVAAMVWGPWALATVTLPAHIAGPLVALERAQLARGGAMSVGVAACLIIYVAGVMVQLVRLLRARRAVHAAAAAGEPADSRWLALLTNAASAHEIASHAVTLRFSRSCRVPMTWGVRRPIILLPASARRWSASRGRAVLLHELAHVMERDATFRLAIAALGVLLWFHPAIWLVAARLASASEEEADDHVLQRGVRPSDYAELLADTLSMVRGPRWASALGGATHSQLRARLARVVDVDRPLGAPGRRVVAAAILLALGAVVPAGTARLVPSRDLLTRLVADTRWESRAYAAVRLAERPDSIHMARTIALRDPNPRVRALTTSALARLTPSTTF